MATTLPNPADQQAPENEVAGPAPIMEEPPPPAPPSFGEKNRHLPDQLKDLLTKLIKQLMVEELYDRRIEDLTDRGLRFYDDGVQHFFANYATGAYQIGQAGAAVNVGEGSFECSEYLGAYNIFRARRRTIDAVLTQNSPGIDFQPLRPDRAEDVEAAETAENYRHLFDAMNDTPALQQHITRMFELSGRTVAWTLSVANQQKWGTNDAGSPRMMETAEIFGTLESTCPILMRKQDDLPYVFLYRDRHIFQLKSENPWLKEDGVWKFHGGESGPGESEWKRYARLGIRQARKGSAVLNTMIGHITTEMHAWLRPSCFEDSCCDDLYTGPAGWDDITEEYDNSPVLDENGEPMSCRDFLLQLFPEGIHVKYCGETYSESEPESMDDSLDVLMPEHRDSMTGGALMEPMKVVQDNYNDASNAETEHYEKGWPMTHFRGDQEDYDTIIDQQSRPNQFNLIKNPVTPADQPLANSFFKEPEMDTPPAFVQWKENLRTAVSQDITGASPALEGTSGPKEETASQRAMDKQQSIGILSPTWSRVQRMFAGIYKKAAIKASANPDHAEEIAVTTGDKRTVTIRLERLRKGKFQAKPDIDSGFPDSTAAQRANLDSTLPTIAATPIGMEMLTSPDNWKEILRIKGMTDFTLVPAIAYDKQVRELDILLREAPEPNPQYQEAMIQHAALALQAEAQGMMAPPAPPIPPELPSVKPEIHDYHMWEYRKCQEYLSSADCWRQILEGNDAGVKNVRLHADMHALMGQMPQPFAPAPPMTLPSQPKSVSKNQTAPPAAQQTPNSTSPNVGGGPPQ